MHEVAGVRCQPGHVGMQSNTVIYLLHLEFLLKRHEKSGIYGEIFHFSQTATWFQLLSKVNKYCGNDVKFCHCMHFDTNLGFCFLIDWNNLERHLK